MKKFLLYLADWIYKKKCYFCKNSNENAKMCSTCFDSIEYNSTDIKREILNVRIYSATIYSSIVQKLIRGVKYHNKKDLAFYQAKLMYIFWQKLNIKQDFQVVPVPLYKKREKSRKYNHMYLVADEFCRLTGYELNDKLVKRIKDTKPQYKLNRKERMENLNNAFLISKENDLKKTVLILDDICTTGATFESIIKTLNANNIDDIICFATATPEF